MPALSASFLLNLMGYSLLYPMFNRNCYIRRIAIIFTSNLNIYILFSLSCSNVCFYSNGRDPGKPKIQAVTKSMPILAPVTASSYLNECNGKQICLNRTAPQDRRSSPRMGCPSTKYKWLAAHPPAGFVRNKPEPSSSPTRCGPSAVAGLRMIAHHSGGGAGGDEFIRVCKADAQGAAGLHQGVQLPVHGHVLHARIPR